MKKKIIFKLSALIFVYLTLAQAQVQQKPFTLSGGYVITQETDYSNNGSSTHYNNGGSYMIGYQNWGPAEGNLSRTWRMIQYFDLRSIPTNAIIMKATVYCRLTQWAQLQGTNGQNYVAQFNLLSNTAYLTACGSTDQTCMAGRFAACTTGTKVWNQKYKDTVKNTVDVTNIAKSAQSTGYIILGCFQSDANAGTSYANFSITITVTYILPFNVTAQNDFPNGTMGIVTPSYSNSSSPVPYTNTGTKPGDAFTLTAITQTDNTGNSRVWNNYAPNNISTWGKLDGH